MGAAPMVSQVRWVAAVATLAVALLFGTVSATESNFTTSKGGFLSFDDVKGKPYEVDFDGRSFAMGGQRTLWVSGSVHREDHRSRRYHHLLGPVPLLPDLAVTRWHRRQGWMCDRWPIPDARPHGYPARLRLRREHRRWATCGFFRW